MVESGRRPSRVAPRAAVALASACFVTHAFAAPCPLGASAAPVVTAADLGAIERAVVLLPAVGTKRIALSAGTPVPRVFETRPVPSAIRKVLPQYAGYRAFRSDMMVAIVDPKARRIAYVLPLRQAPAGSTCGK